MREGVRMVDPSRTYIDATVTLGPEVELLPGVVLEGATTVGTGSVIGPDTRLVNTVVGQGATVSYSVATDAEIGDAVTVGPFTHLRPGTRLGHPGAGRAGARPRGAPAGGGGGGARPGAGRGGPRRGEPAAPAPPEGDEG